MQQEVEPILIPNDLWEYPSWMWQINEEFTDGSRTQHLYLVDDKVPIKDWYIDDTNQVRKTVISDPNYWDVRPSYNAIICTTDPQLIADGIPSISDEFLKQFVVAQGKGKIMMEIHTRLRHLEDGLSEDVSLVYAPIKTDESGNAILTIVKDIVMDDPLLNIDGQLMHCIECNAPLKNGEGLLLGYCEKCCTGSGSVEESAKQVIQNNNLPTEGDFAEGFITGAIFGAEWQKEQNKPSIPTNEEIREIGKEFVEKYQKDMNAATNDRWSIYGSRMDVLTSFYQGYKQALKDLGYE